jgi:hypothetical protein
MLLESRHACGHQLRLLYCQIAPCCFASSPSLTYDSANSRSHLLQAEEAWRLAKEQKNHELWDAKMKATQTASAFGIRVT